MTVKNVKIRKYSACEASNPYHIADKKAYHHWRDIKLATYPIDESEWLVNINNLDNVDRNEKLRILQHCNKYNMAVYQTNDKMTDSGTLCRFAKNFKLYRLNRHRYASENGISAVSISENTAQEEFIPYTNKQLGWHTDGYYNQRSQRVYAFILHCVEPAASGGINKLLDPDIAYIRLRDENPHFIEALMAPDCMTIPAYDIGDGQRRPESTGPVFDIEPTSGKLYMRYTARKHNIVWKNDALTIDAVAFLTEILANEDYVITHKLQAGQGIITNNVLHNRTSFVDNPDKKRLLYRARYLERITEIEM